jgi:hypothetical protein
MSSWPASWSSAAQPEPPAPSVTRRRPAAALPVLNFRNEDRHGASAPETRARSRAAVGYGPAMDEDGYATTTVDGRFSLAYLVFNTIMNLTTQDAQVACFRNAAAHLRPGGCFVIEVMVPELRKLPDGQDTVPCRISPGRWAFDHYDTATQAMSSNYVEVSGGRGEYRSIPFRYVWPAELDLMARLAGMRLRERWAGWTREPFTSDSREHVSVWEKLP